MKKKLSLSNTRPPPPTKTTMGFLSTLTAAVSDTAEASLASLSLNEKPAAEKQQQEATTKASPSAAAATTTAPLALRASLPPPQGEPRPFSLWSFLKDAAGKQLFVLPLPIGFYLPLTEIQFRLEALEYSSALLDAAAACPAGSADRAARVAAFALSHYAATVRLGKPLLPMHGETYDIVDPNGKFRVVGEAVYTSFKEQTIRHAWFAESMTFVEGSSSSSSSASSTSSPRVPLWKVESDDQPVVGFKGTHLDFHLNWRDLITFADGEAFCYTKPTSVLGNLLGKKHTLTHRGCLSLRSSRGVGVDLKFLGEPGGAGSRLASMFGGKSSEDAATVEHEVRGVVMKKELGDGEETLVDDDEASIGSGSWAPLEGAPLLHGQWHRGLWAVTSSSSSGGAAGGEEEEEEGETEEEERTLLWEVSAGGEREPRFDLSPFALRLNALDASLEKALPPTDSRRRPDLRALEEGRFDEAYDLKMRLETALVARVAEHAARVKKENNSATFADASPAPRWFAERSPGSLLLKAGTPALRYRYKGGYWEARASGEWGQGVNEGIFDAAAK